MVVGYCGVGGAGAAVGEGEGGSNREVKVLNSELDTRAQFFSVQIHFFSQNPKILKYEFVVLGLGFQHGSNITVFYSDFL